MNNFMLVSDGDETYAYSPMNSFTTVDLGCERGNNMTNIVVRVESQKAPSSCRPSIRCGTTRKSSRTSPARS